MWHGHGGRGNYQPSSNGGLLVNEVREKKLPSEYFTRQLQTHFALAQLKVLGREAIGHNG